MKKWILKNIFIAAVSYGCAINANAVGNGFYLGLMLGPANNNAPSLQALRDPVPSSPPITTNADPRLQQFASRIFLGNKFNTYAAFEAGLTFFSSIKYDSHGVLTTGSTDQRVRDIDVVLKGIFPFGESFDIYGKAGIAGTYLTTGGSFNPVFNEQTKTYSTANSYKSKFSPTISVGGSYAINQSWVVDLSYNNVQVGGNVGQVVFYALGLSYHFTDRYCGQFLCDD
jgi:opacity protein-like surface antigen